MGNTLSCRPQSYGKYSHTAYAHLQEIGVKCVEIPTPRPDQIAKVRNELARHGLHATSLEGTLDLKDPAAVEKLRPQVAAATELGAKIIFLSVQRGEMEKSAAYALLREAGDVAAAGGVTLAMETHPDLVANAEVAVETMRGVNHPNVRVNFDTANIYYYNQGVDGLAELKKVLEYVGAVHLKESNGQPRTWWFPALGEGIVDFKEVFRILNASGFYGPFTMEIEGVEGENLSLEQTQQRIAQSVEHLRKLGCVV